MKAMTHYDNIRGQVMDSRAEREQHVNHRTSSLKRYSHWVELNQKNIKRHVCIHMALFNDNDVAYYVIDVPQGQS
jgi:hypothetical protein